MKKIILILAVMLFASNTFASSPRQYDYKQAMQEKGIVYVLGNVTNTEPSGGYTSSGNKMYINTYIVTLNTEKTWGLENSVSVKFYYDINLNFTPDRPKEIIGTTGLFALQKQDDGSWKAQNWAGLEVAEKVLDNTQKQSIINKFAELGISEGKKTEVTKLQGFTETVYSCKDGSVGFGSCQELKNNSCPNLKFNLVMGRRDAVTKGEVSKLQTFLKNFLKLSDQQFLVTGNFGKVTAKFLAQFQQQNNLVVTGSLNRNTRDKIAKACGDDPLPVNVHSFSANPSSGQAPLTVNFSSWYGGRTREGNPTLNFGDGASEMVGECFAPTDACSRTGTNTHTYTKSGTYIATIVRDPCKGNSACKAPVQILESQIITVDAVLNVYNQLR